MAEVWYREKIKITIHVNIKYLVHGIEWGVTPPHSLCRNIF
jgi:hypothetical protein